MNLAGIAKIRLISQQIAGTKFKAVKDIVAWMGAMQAQDYAMVKWAIGVRLPNTIDRAIEAAIDNGEIIRTHLLRPTWHFVSADDIYWLLGLTAPQIKASLKSRHKAVSNNGIFRPVIVVNGQVIGIWKRTAKKDLVIVETDFFKQPPKSMKDLVEKAAVSFGQFLEKKTEIKFK